VITKNELCTGSRHEYLYTNINIITLIYV